VKWLASARTLAAQVTARLVTHDPAQYPSAATIERHGPAESTANPSAPAGPRGLPQDALAKREAAIARARETRSHKHRLQAQAATLACLTRKGG
jgi:hypothetical protein